MKKLKNIFVESTLKTPQVDFNCLTGDLILSGRSIPENANELYEPLLKWVNEYILAPRPTTNFRINLEYFNTASSLWFARIGKALSRMSDPENILFIHQYLGVEEFDNLQTDDLKDALSPVVDIINNTVISIGVKIYGTDEKGEIIKESIVLL